MVIVPLQALAHQVRTCVLGGQACTLEVYSKQDNLYLNLSVGNTPLLSGVLCLNRVLLVRFSYLGFVGDLSFVDLQGSSDPAYRGLGTRYVLCYLSPGDYTQPL